LEIIDMTFMRSHVFLFAGGRDGDREKDKASLREAIESCAIASPAIAYLGAASGDNFIFRKMITAYLHAAGAGDVRLAPLSGRRFDRSLCEKILRDSDLIYCSGGDVEKGMKVLAQREMIPLLRELHLAGKPFLAHSAGSIMLAKEWICWSDPDDDTSAKSFLCLGFAPIICDTHSESDDWEELRTLLKMKPDGTIGYGLRSGAGIRVSNDGIVERIAGVVDKFTKTKERLHQTIM
jgi:peptidase E